mgnify:FL=1
MIPTVPKTHEPFIGGFTGSLSTYTAADGKRYVFAKPLPRIERGRRYMMVIEGVTIKLLPIIV